ncbi:H+-ATPase G subunit-domain-containing protein [Pavlovales sp. CCMP2436]|nr:H+-ATPase G subunit-domain-containing protein [Pavlovales sp. CCMP2436]
MRSLALESTLRHEVLSPNFDFENMDNSAHMGIQRLLEAESQASEVVAQAKKDKVLRLKLAKEEAENEIMAYRQLREEQFQKYASEGGF